MIYKILKDTEDALTYYTKIGDKERLAILKEGIIYYLKNLVER